MVRDYTVIDNNDMTKLHWNTGMTNDWADFLLECRNKLSSGEYSPSFRVLIDGYEYCKVGELL